MQFKTTMWTMIGRAREGSHQAMEGVLSRYRRPVIQYLRQQGMSEPDAEDISQEVFLRIGRKEFLEKADREKGKFRTLLLRVTQHVRASDYRRKYSQKRGGGKAAVPLEEISEMAVAPADEEAFNGTWAKDLIERALERLKKSSSRLGVSYHEALIQRYIENKSYREISTALGCKESDVVNYIHHGKARLKTTLSELAKEYTSSPEEYAEELELLARYSP